MSPRREQRLVRPADKPEDVPVLVFKRGSSHPRAIAWLGFRSFWGHMWHLAASVIATEDIDARDWMEPIKANVLTRRAAEILLGDCDGRCLTERLGRDLWLDFVADTGDDADVSAAVGEMLSAVYEIEDSDGEPVKLPRGDVLLFGGDTAYPVATDAEIHNRVCLPFNKSLRERQDGRLRVLLGIPGNHDWYDGLDGFGRLFRARRGNIARASVIDDSTAYRTGRISHLFEWVDAFRIGDHVDKRSTLQLLGYVPIQRSSYFSLNLAPQLDLWAVDRQLRTVDYGQRVFFMEQRARAENGLIVMMADPAHAFLEPNRVGAATLETLNLDIADDGLLILTGDTHHYCRQNFGDGMHVIAGGGGAFLHPARMERRNIDPPAAEFPGPRASFALAMQVPWQIAAGRAGFIPHVVLGVMYTPILLTQLSAYDTAIACILVGVVATLGCSLLCGWRQERAGIILLLSTLCGAWIGGLPYVTSGAVDRLVGDRVGNAAQAIITYVATIYPAVLGVGTLLMIVTLVALEQHQAFSALAHPGYKHFVRLRVRKDGQSVDGWVLGKVNTLLPDEPVRLIDHFTWHNPAASPNSGTAADHADEAPASNEDSSR